MTLFSLIVPTRNRLVPLRSLLTSIEKTTYDLQSIELFVICDDDDTETIQAIKLLEDEYTIPLRFIIRRRRTKQLVDIHFNKTVPFTKGQYIIALADDVLFMTNHWDKILLEKLEHYLADKPDGIVYGRTYDEKEGKHQLFYHGRNSALFFEVDLNKIPLVVDPPTDKIKLVKDGKKIIVKAEIIVQEDVPFRVINTYVVKSDENKRKMVIVYGKEEKIPFSCFPLFSRKAVDVLGHIFDGYIEGQGADFAIGKVYFDVDRVLDLPEITIRHSHITDDNVHEDLKKRSTKNSWFVIANNITRDVEKLKKHIELCKIIDFSLIVPTRDRFGEVIALLTSIEKTTYNPSSIEVFLICDDDDQKMLQSIKELEARYANIPLKFVIRQRNIEQWVETYFNQTVHLTKGRYIFPLVDDVLFMTNHWDKILLEKLEHYLADKPDRIVYGRTKGDKWDARPSFWSDKKGALWFEVDPEKYPIGAKPYTEGIIVKKTGQKIMIKADPILWEGKEYRPLRVYQEYTDGRIMCVYGEKRPVRFTCFPVISREAINVLGHIFVPSCNAQGSDFVIAKVYQDVDRILDLPEVTIQHLHKVDALHKNIERVSTMTNGFIVTDDVTKDVEKLKKHIELCKKWS